MRSLLLFLSCCIVNGCAPPSSSGEAPFGDELQLRRNVDGGTDAGSSPPDAGQPLAGCVAPRVDDATVAFKFNPGPREIRPGALYLIYSGMKSLVDVTFYESSNIYLVKGHPTPDGVDVFIFGAGYSDPNGDVLAMRLTMDAIRSGAADAADADSVIRFCMGLDPARVNLHFITPHWHVDHINQAFLGALIARGYDVARLTIQTHLNDHALAFCGARCPGAASVPPFTEEIKARASTVGTVADTCNTPVTSFETPDFGTWNVLATPGHTKGTLSLQNDLLRVRLPGGGGRCALPQGFVISDLHSQVTGF